MMLFNEFVVQTFIIKHSAKALISGQGNDEISTQVSGSLFYTASACIKLPNLLNQYLNRK